jgi:hypothetical protein
MRVDDTEDSPAAVAVSMVEEGLIAPTDKGHLVDLVSVSFEVGKRQLQRMRAQDVGVGSDVAPSSPAAKHAPA